MTTTDTNLNQLIINELTQAEYDTITPNANELYITTDGIMESTDVINALGYTPVNKSGDTMTGNLEISNVFPNVNCTNTVADYTDTTAPATTLDIGNFSVFDKNGKAVGGINCQHNIYNNCVTTLYARRSIGGAEKNAYNTLWVDSSGDGHFTFPQSSCVDGQWVNADQQIISTATSLNGSTSLTYRVDLPNDGQKYEVMIRGMGYANTTAGNEIYINVLGNNDTGGRYIGRVRAGVAGTFVASGTAIVTCSYVAIGSTNLTVARNTSWNGSCTELRVIAYRRIGTNT